MFTNVGNDKSRSIWGVLRSFVYTYMGGSLFQEAVREGTRSPTRVGRSKTAGKGKGNKSTGSNSEGSEGTQEQRSVIDLCDEITAVVNSIV